MFQGMGIVEFESLSKAFSEISCGRAKSELENGPSDGDGETLVDLREEDVFVLRHDRPHCFSPVRQWVDGCHDPQIRIHAFSRPKPT